MCLWLHWHWSTSPFCWGLLEIHGHLPTTDLVIQYFLKKNEKLSCKLYHIFVLLKTNYSLQAEKVHELNEDIGKLLAKAEQLGAEGNVDESQKILMEVEKVRAKKKEAEVQCWLPCELSQEPGLGWVVPTSVPVCWHLLLQFQPCASKQVAVWWEGWKAF